MKKKEEEDPSYEQQNTNEPLRMMYAINRIYLKVSIMVEAVTDCSSLIVKGGSLTSRFETIYPIETRLLEA